MVNPSEDTRSKALREEQYADLNRARRLVNAESEELRKNGFTKIGYQKIIRRYAPPLVASMEAHAKASRERFTIQTAKWLKGLGWERVALVCIDATIRRCAEQATGAGQGPFARILGRALELEERALRLEEEHPLEVKRVRDRENADSMHFHMSMADLLRKFGIRREREAEDLQRMGTFVIVNMLAIGLVVQTKVVFSKGTVVNLTLHPDVQTQLTEIGVRDIAEVWDRSHSLMEVPPDPHKGVEGGGYLTAHRKALAPLLNMYKIRKSDRERVSETFKPESMPIVFDAVNYIQSIPFTFHSAVRSHQIALWERGDGSMGIPLPNPPEEPVRPPMADYRDKANGGKNKKEWSELTDAVRDAVMDFNRQVKEWREALLHWRTRRIEVGGVVRGMNGKDKVWCPTFVDTRGRVYYRGIPNPQSTDIGKGVLHFAEKLPLGPRGLFWLKVQFANSYGYDKTTFDDRVAWVDRNWETIEAALDDPASHEEVWGDSPWCAFSAAWEIREAIRSGNPETYCTGQPVTLDATCSGLQHVSALLRDEYGGALVNLTPGDGVQKCDIYTHVAHQTLKALEEEMHKPYPEDATPKQREKIREDRAKAAWWVQQGITRKMAKKPVMTYCYSATPRSAGESVYTELVAKYGKPSAENPWERQRGHGYKDAMWLGVRLHAQVEKEFPKAAEFMRYMQRLAAAAGDRKITWISPSGFEAQQDYREMGIVTVKLSSLNRKFHVGVSGLGKELDTINPKTTKQSIAPNFIHSLDAAHIHLVAATAKKRGIPLLCIHDCIGMHPSNVDEMSRIIRACFVAMYSEDRLQGAWQDICPDYAEPPQPGDLDIRKVLDSQFFFC